MSAIPNLTEKPALLDSRGGAFYSVIAQHGQITLKGPVRSDDEKRTVEAKGHRGGGRRHVTNQISVAPPKSAKR